MSHLLGFLVAVVIVVGGVGIIYYRLKKAKKYYKDTVAKENKVNEDTVNQYKKSAEQKYKDLTQGKKED